MTDNTDGHAILDSHAIGRKYGDEEGGNSPSKRKRMLVGKLEFSP